MIPKFRFWDKQELNFVAYLNNIVLKYDGTIEGIEYEMTGEGNVYNDISYFEVMQSTGLKDKNSVEIFEGDIVKVQAEDPEPKIRADRYETGVMIYVYGSFDIVTKSKRVSGLIPESYLTDIQLTFEVIGNKYQHPHLLEE